MPTSERVLSGSKSKGSRVTQEKEAVPFHQGLSVRSFDKTGDRLIPVGRSGDIFGIFKDNTRVGVSFFDDTIELNNTPEDIRGASGIIESKDIPSKFEKRLVFDFEKANFGQPLTYPLEEPFADLMDYQAKSYIEDQGLFMYPVNLWNLGELPKHEFDGVIEPLDIRSEILQIVNTKYEGRAIRGSLVGGASERPWGSKEIVDEWEIADNEDRPFLDAPQHFLAPKIEDLPATKLVSKSILEHFWTDTFTLDGNTYSSAKNVQLFAYPNQTSPQDLSGKGVALSNEGGGLTEVTATIGSATWPAFQNNAGSGASRLQLGTAAYWNGIIGDKGGGSSFPRTLIQKTYSIWVKQTPGEHATYAGGALFALGGPNESNTGGINIEYGRFSGYAMGPIDPRTGPSDHLNNHRRFGVHIYDKSSGYGDTWTTEGWNWLADGEWHNFVVVVEIDNVERGPNNVPQGWTPSVYGSPTTNLTMYVDGVQVNAFFAYPNFTNADVDAAFPASSHFQLNPAGRARVGSGYGSFGGNRFYGQFTLPAIWDSVLQPQEVAALYTATRRPHPRYSITTVPQERGPILKSFPFQSYQDITQAPDHPLVEKDYHDVVYRSLSLHNGADMKSALRLLNSSSCDTITDPFQKTSARGFYFGPKAGSITFGNMYTLGEYE